MPRGRAIASARASHRRAAHSRGGCLNAAPPG
jgi:hypothetical protein